MVLDYSYFDSIDFDSLLEDLIDDPFSILIDKNDANLSENGLLSTSNSSDEFVDLTDGDTDKSYYKTHNTYKIGGKRKKRTCVLRIFKNDVRRSYKGWYLHIRNSFIFDKKI